MDCWINTHKIRSTLSMEDMDVTYFENKKLQPDFTNSGLERTWYFLIWDRYYIIKINISRTILEKGRNLHTA